LYNIQDFIVFRESPYSGTSINPRINFDKSKEFFARHRAGAGKEGRLASTKYVSYPSDMIVMGVSSEYHQDILGGINADTVEVCKSGERAILLINT
jgi:hypothetical protein